jgi:hypothetical protein
VLVFNWETAADTPQAVLGAASTSPSKYYVYKVRGHYVDNTTQHERRGTPASFFFLLARVHASQQSQDCFKIFIHVLLS